MKEITITEDTCVCFQGGVITFYLPFPEKLTTDIHVSSPFQMTEIRSKCSGHQSLLVKIKVPDSPKGWKYL